MIHILHDSCFSNYLSSDNQNLTGYHHGTMIFVLEVSKMMRWLFTDIAFVP